MPFIPCKYRLCVFFYYKICIYEKLSLFCIITSLSLPYFLLIFPIISSNDHFTKIFPFATKKFPFARKLFPFPKIFFPATRKSFPFIRKNFLLKTLKVNSFKAFRGFAILSILYFTYIYYLSSTFLPLVMKYSISLTYDHTCEI